MMPCMLCNNAKAAVYCYNDNAYLCKACDGQIHNKNKLAWRHQRSHLCEECDSVPPKLAAVYCAQDEVRARACFSPPEPSRWGSRGRVPEIPERREKKRTRASRFSVARPASVVRRLPRRGTTVDTRATCDVRFRDAHPPRLASVFDARADRSVLTARHPARRHRKTRRTRPTPRLRFDTRVAKKTSSRDFANDPRSPILRVASSDRTQAYLCLACDNIVHAANSIASTHERTPVSAFTEEGVSGGQGAPERSGGSGDDDGLFADLLAGGGDAFAGLPEIDGGAGFLVDDPNDPTSANAANAHARLVKRERGASPDGGLKDATASSPRDDAARADSDRPGRDSAGSAAGRKADGESSAGAAGSGSNASHSQAGIHSDHRQGETLSAGADAGLNRGSLASVGLTMDDYASLERVGASSVDDFLGPIMDDHAGVGFGDDTAANAATWNPHALRRDPSPGAFANAPQAGGASDAALAQARAQAEARARAMHHARALGMGAPVGAPGGMGPSGSSAAVRGSMQGGLGRSAEQGLGGAGGSMPGGGPGSVGPGPGAPRGAPPGTHGMPPPPFGVGPPAPPPGPGVSPVHGPNGMLYFSGPPLPMLHLTNGASDAPPSRLERLRRWKEKRKNRNFNKTIRYQSRKVCADNRPRIKGKFVKVGSTPDLGAMDDLGADFERARTAGGPGGSSLGDVPEHEESAEDSMGSGGPPPEGRLARVGGLRRGGGLTNSMSVPAGLAMMGAKEESA